MRVILLVAGFFAALFLIPMFMQIWNAMTPTFTSQITDPFVTLFYVIAPYAAVAVIVVAAFYIASGRGKQQ